MSLLQASSTLLQFWIHVNQATPPEKKSKSHPLSMICSCGTPAQQCSHIWIHHPDKGNRVWSHTPVVLQICQNRSSAFYPYMHFTCPDIMAFQDSIPSDRPNLKVAHLVVGNSFSISMLNAPSHFAFMSTKLPIPPQRHKTYNPLWVMICWWTTCLPYSSSQSAITTTRVHPSDQISEGNPSCHFSGAVINSGVWFTFRITKNPLDLGWIPQHFCFQNTIQQEHKDDFLWTYNTSGSVWHVRNMLHLSIPAFIWSIF